MKPVSGHSTAGFHGVSLKAELAVWVTTASGALRNWLGVTQFLESRDKLPHRNQRRHG
jgi:hypothetical protein